ncbi:MAG: lipopolysaccharide biosynthesis protein [Planctomycetaceae bacterium]|nr:lipopolysaccharide biosynthesis protein [Planctomycetaceae bacterium]
MKPVRDLLKHSSVYMIGQILTRMTSVLLLPFYTHALTTADYGVVGILDLTCAILSTFIAGGMISAVTRHHFDGDDEQHHDGVWWTGLTMVFVVASVLAVPMILGRQTLADLTLGTEITQGAWFYLLAIGTMWFTVLGMILDNYLRVLKMSGVFVMISLGRLVVNIGLNVWLIAGMKMGVEGLLVGNLIATVLHTSILMCVFVKTRGGYRINTDIGWQMYRFATPLVFTALGSMLMHEADRYFLRIWESMSEVGVYSFAHKIGFAVNTLCLLPFISIWHVAIYDIERLPSARHIFEDVFGWFTSGLGILLLGASLCVHPVLPMLTPEAYGDAMDLISVVLLGFYVFGLSFMFEVPSLLTKRTRLMLPAAIGGVVVTFGANVALIPVLGTWGAAWAGVITYATYSFTILFMCRRAMKLNYPWLRFAGTTSAFIATYVILRYACFPHIGPVAQIAASVLVCAMWSAVLFGKQGLEFAVTWLKHKRQGGSLPAERQPEPVPEPVTEELVEV